MASLINVSAISKTFGIAPLFENITLNISEGDRLGLIGPNGAGKSTLLEILTGRREPDTGDVALRKGTRLAYVTQDSQFPAGLTVRQVVHAAMIEAKVAEEEKLAREAETLGRAGFEDLDQQASALSGGWRKRLAVAEALVQSPDIVMLDEPTNHLDLAGIAWLEDLLTSASFACVVVSHDRYFLENVATAMVELNPAFPNGTFYVTGNYSTFLEKKGEFLHAQAKHQDALENRVKTEMEWLRRGPKARATKSKARIDKAQEMIGELKDLKIRTRVELTDIDFSATDRKTKRLVHLEKVSHGFGESVLFDNANFTITAGMRVGLVGANGSGKTTLLRLLKGEIAPMKGEIQKADNLRIVSFDQIREIDQSLTLRRALAPNSDSVIYRDRVTHVASWAAKFLFTSEQLNQPVRRLSGGERARVLIAQLMVEPADLLLLDEPTNDLDIPTLEILEESLLEFQGALILVTHDRYLLDRVATVVLGLDGKGGAERFADYSQWNEWQVAKKPVKASNVPAPKAAAVKKKLSYIEARDYETIEHRVAEAEVALEAQHDAVQAAASLGGKELEAAMKELEKRQLAVDELYERWAELEGKLK
ncbi:MAG TPA: ABC-F family ATP-binding cassette domain-containing protein [Bryobacteraceae bacterium]|jgi:ATP-binding cassette subfamily F protein uup|nr:ABC-F family ATP-binding cassette domain-containing protein [Bryobacteraceae bacterium]